MSRDFIISLCDRICAAHEVLAKMAERKHVQLPLALDLYDTISFVVTCAPVAQPRQRHRISNKGGKAFAQNYTPANHPVNTFKTIAQIAAREAWPGCQPMKGPLVLKAAFVLPRPKRLIWKNRLMARLPCEAKPDLDNLLKSLKDALTGIIWLDDSQVVRVEANKWYAAGDEQPGVEVSVSMW